MDVLNLVLLAVHFKSGDFLMDVVVPGVAAVAVLLMIGNSLLNHWGYRLW